MECRHLLAPAAAGLLLVAGVRVRAEEAAPRTLLVAGGDFPALVMVVPGEQAGFGREMLPGCDRIRARRLDELAPGWRTRVARVELDCEDTLADDARDALTAITARAVLQPDRVRMADQPVAEIRLMDSQRWGDHQYVVDAPYATAAPALRRLVEEACRQRTLAQEMPLETCTMVEADAGFYLPHDEVGGIWIHADPDDATRTLYVEAWAD
ncbi:hypothetical protein LJR125_001134 [Pseudoxanthomonas sp. LjRoot125]|uniref:hypothetical protein n=1 Tax=Pseudoxanthomonas sp. LjRoot125 TaxID=3342258 RepID=UPI003E123DBA